MRPKMPTNTGAPPAPDLASRIFDGQSASQLVHGLRSQFWTSVELTHYFLNRIARLDHGVHSVAFTFAETALAQAAESDRRRSMGQARGPLDGLPMTIKDSLRVKGLRSTYGLFLFRQYCPRNDSLVAQAMREEGIVFLGRTAVPTGAFDWNCRNQVYAECVNPFDRSRTPGGSSGGAAAALALGLTPLELGSDLGGSIRYPAHCCGIYGLRTTDGLLPVDDIGPEKVGTAFRQMVTLGPMANSLADLRLLMDLFERRLPNRPGKVLIAGKKIAYTPRMFGVGLERDSQMVFDSYLSDLRTRGFALEEVQPPVAPEILFRVWGIVAGFEYTNTMPRFLRRRFFKNVYAWWLLERRLGRGSFATHFRAGLLATPAQYEAALRERDLIFKNGDSFFSKYGAWILPVARGPAFALRDSGKRITSEGETFTYADYVGAFTVPTTALGTPVLTIPIGLTKAELPMGVQIFGPRFSDSSLLDFGAQLLARPSATVEVKL